MKKDGSKSVCYAAVGFSLIRRAEGHGDASEWAGILNPTCEIVSVEEFRLDEAADFLTEDQRRTSSIAMRHGS